MYTWIGGSFFKKLVLIFYITIFFTIIRILIGLYYNCLLIRWTIIIQRIHLLYLSNTLINNSLKWTIVYKYYYYNNSISFSLE